MELTLEQLYQKCGRKWDRQAGGPLTLKPK